MKKKKKTLNTFLINWNWSYINRTFSDFPIGFSVYE